MVQIRESIRPGIPADSYVTAGLMICDFDMRVPLLVLVSFIRFLLSGQADLRPSIRGSRAGSAQEDILRLLNILAVQLC
jgi:hypothetical protein